MERNETQTWSVIHGDWFTWQKSGHNLQAFRKKVPKTVWSLKFTKSKAGNFTKNQRSVTKLKLDLQVMVTDLHAKNQVNIYKHLEKKSGKLLDR